MDMNVLKRLEKFKQYSITKYTHGYTVLVWFKDNQVWSATAKTLEEAAHNAVLKKEKQHIHLPVP